MPRCYSQRAYIDAGLVRPASMIRSVKGGMAREGSLHDNR